MNLDMTSDDLPQDIEKSFDDFSLDEARTVLRDMMYFFDVCIITACHVIEKEGTTSEKRDFCALRAVVERRFD